MTILSDFDYACRDIAIALAEEVPPLDAAAARRLHLAKMLIGDFRHKMRELHREPSGALPDGWPVA